LTDPDLETLLKPLWILAQAACADITAFQPDLVIALAHSARGPLRAAQTLWAETRPDPFPPTLITNLGREKLDRYDELRDRLGMHPFIEWVFGDVEAAHLLAWVTPQIAWREELTGQVRATLGADAPPRRVLVLDENVYEGGTWVMALGLVHDAFPGAEARFIAGGEGWIKLGQAWLARFHPEIVEGMRAAQQQERQQQIWLDCFWRLNHLTPGTEDVERESLAWRPITAQSPRVQSLADFLPAEEWLRMPVWAAGVIEDYVRSRVRCGDAATASAPPEKAPSLEATRLQLRAEHLVFRRAWLHDHITPSEAAHVCRLREDEAKGLLERLAQEKYLFRRGDESSPRYQIFPQTGILAYGPVLADPGSEIESSLRYRIENQTTPFQVEFAYSDPRFAGAPTLARVPDGRGSFVHAQLLVIRPDADSWYATQILYRRLVGRVGDESVFFDEDEQSQFRYPLWVKEMAELERIPNVVYAHQKPNLHVVVTDGVSPRTRARVLARLAIQSLTPETLAARQDGLQYLADAIRGGVHTPLTPLYVQELLQQAGNAPDLETARLRLARQKGIA
jgi:hypothetical protein